MDYRQLIVLFYLKTKQNNKKINLLFKLYIYIYSFYQNIKTIKINMHN